MSVGAAVRRAFGPYEWHIAEAWRRLFVDLDSFADQLGRWTRPSRILEIGCGEGAMTERLVRMFPNADVVAIDITPNTGRLFRGDTRRVSFRQARAEDVAAEQPASFDHVLLADVIHHVPLSMRADLLASARRAMAPGGRFVFKDWARRPSVGHLACFIADRYVTGDDVHYHNEQELRALATGAFGAGSIVAQAWIRPWRSNFAMLVAAA
jgi:2-polyprenyl-6-hydroxyphenyl methylase/3-demethylubiquinone-9 3-methyltransferase